MDAAYQALATIIDNAAFPRLPEDIPLVIAKTLTAKPVLYLRPWKTIELAQKIQDGIPDTDGEDTEDKVIWSTPHVGKKTWLDYTQCVL